MREKRKTRLSRNLLFSPSYREDDHVSFSTPCSDWNRVVVHSFVMGLESQRRSIDTRYANRSSRSTTRFDRILTISSRVWLVETYRSVRIAVTLGRTRDANRSPNTNSSTINSKTYIRRLVRTCGFLMLFCQYRNRKAGYASSRSI